MKDTSSSQERLETLLSEGCREELGAEANYSKCWEPAEFILWGKLLPPEALGPRCYEHAAKHVGHRALTDKSYAIFHLGVVRELVSHGRSPS